MKGNALPHRAGNDPDPAQPVIEHKGRNANLLSPKGLRDQGNAVGRRHGRDQDPDPVGPDQDDIIAPGRRGGPMVDEGRDAGLGVIAKELEVTAPLRGKDGEDPIKHGEGPHQADPREGDPKTRGDKTRGEVDRGEGRRIPIARRKGGPGAEGLTQ